MPKSIVALLWTQYRHGLTFFLYYLAPTMQLMIKGEEEAGIGQWMLLKELARREPQNLST